MQDADRTNPRNLLAALRRLVRPGTPLSAPIPGTEADRQDIQLQRKKLERSGRLHGFHYAVVGFSFMLTFVVWQFSSRQVTARSEAQFDRSSDQILALIAERMEKYEQGLWAGTAMIHANNDRIDALEWQTFARNLEIDVKYPGINGIGVIYQVRAPDLPAFLAEQRSQQPGFTLHPEREADLYLPITFIEPLEINAQAVGLDIAFESNRHQGLMAARDSGQAHITGPIHLVQDEGATAGFLFYAPLYRNERQETLLSRRESFIGAVYAPFVVRNLMLGTLHPETRDLRVTIRDGGQIIYDELTASDESLDADPMFTRRASLDLYGRRWDFDIRTNLAFRAANTQSQPLVILFGGIAIDTMLLFFFVLLSRASRRAMDLAGLLTEALEREKVELERSNAALEEYAYISSHDLKTPLRGMRDAAEYLAEDLSASHPDAFRDPAVSSALEAQRVLIDRMEDLVAGILDYARVGRKVTNVSEFDPLPKIQSIARQLGLTDGGIEYSGTFPRLLSDLLRFDQVVSNLLQNALQHHHDPGNIHIIASGNVDGDAFTLTIQDNGPGIPERYHEKVFEVFQALNPNGTGNSTGVGLAIVRRAIEALGGRIELESAPGAGSTFRIILPGSVVPAQSRIAAE